MESKDVKDYEEPCSDIDSDASRNEAKQSQARQIVSWRNDAKRSKASASEATGAMENAPSTTRPSESFLRRQNKCSDITCDHYWGEESLGDRPEHKSQMRLSAARQ